MIRPHSKSLTFLPSLAVRALILFSVCQVALGAVFHMAPDGDDAAPGTRERPFASLRKAQAAASPGDTVFIKGGIYQMKESDIAQRDGFLASIILLDKNGARDRPIRYFAEPGGRPVFDCSQVTPRGLRISAFRVRASWIHLRGISITGVQVTATGHTQSICVENFGDHNLYENLAMHDGQAIGLFITRGADNLVLNCDAYRNHDHTSGNRKGGNTDGFGCHVERRGANNIFRGCRAWFNSDDGFDCINHNDAVVFENCWAMYNGYSVDFTALGDGHGFKAGGYGVNPKKRFPDPIPRHRVERCLAVRNRVSGFYANHHPGGIDWIHNSAHRNGVNYNFLGRRPDGKEDVPGFGHRILNNLSFGSSRDFRNLDIAASSLAGNTFTRGDKVADNHFLSLDERSLIAPRGANGELPAIRFLQLAPGNPWIDTGSISAATPTYHGSAPDPGAFEAQN
jgi:hypothetical protein